MNITNGLPDFMDIALQTIRFGVLATEGYGQPHASLIAITPVERCRKLIFATYRSTRKFRNLAHNGKVAILFEVENSDRSGLLKSYVITAFGNAEEILVEEHDATRNAHLKRHPDLGPFLRSADCALMLVKVEAYQVVRGIDDVRWWPVDHLTET
jgi:hypothetical protein